MPSRAPAPIPLASLTLADARELHGKPATFVVMLDSTPEEHGGYVFYDCESANDLPKCVRFRDDPAIADPTKPVIVRGHLRLIRHKATVIDGMPFVGFWEVMVAE